MQDRKGFCGKELCSVFARNFNLKKLAQESVSDMQVCSAGFLSMYSIKL